MKRILVVALVLGVAACAEQKLSPTAPSSTADGGLAISTLGGANSESPEKVAAHIENPVGFPMIQGMVVFPPRNEPNTFFQNLQALYRDTLGRPQVGTFVDSEGQNVWLTEYFRFYLNGCSHAEATSRTLTEISSGSSLPTCGAENLTFPPRNLPNDFQNQLQSAYRDVLRRPQTLSYVDSEGANVWLAQYLRFRVAGGCDHASAESKVFAEIRGGGVQPDCTRPASPGVTGGARVRVVYANPIDRPIRVEYAAAIESAMLDLRVWYQRELSGQTFSLVSTRAETCALAHEASFYPNGTYGKVLTDVRRCLPVSGNTSTAWVIYADVEDGCNDTGRLGVGGPGLTIMGSHDLHGLVGEPVFDSCGAQYRFPIGRYIGGAGHEMGHAFGLSHPPGCDAGLTSCDANALMWSGYSRYPNTFLREDDKVILRNSQFFR